MKTIAALALALLTVSCAHRRKPAEVLPIWIITHQSDGAVVLTGGCPKGYVLIVPGGICRPEREK